MKSIIFALIALASATATAKEATSCVNLTGNYELPLQRHQRTDARHWVMEINQDKCHLMDIIINEDGAIPISPPFLLDGTENWYVVKDTIVLKLSGNTSFVWNSTHGECEAKNVTFSLDADNNLVMSSPKVVNCEDKYKGALKETYPRLK